MAKRRAPDDLVTWRQAAYENRPLMDQLRRLSTLMPDTLRESFTHHELRDLVKFNDVFRALWVRTLSEPPLPNEERFWSIFDLPIGYLRHGRTSERTLREVTASRLSGDRDRGQIDSDTYNRWREAAERVRDDLN